MYVATVIGIGGLIYLFLTVDTSLVWETIRAVSAYWFTLYVLLATLMILGFSFAWWLAISPFDTKLTFKQVFNARMAGFSISYLTPGSRIGGEVVRASVLKNSSTSLVLASSVIEKIGILLSSTLLVFLGILLFPLLFTSVSFWWSLLPIAILLLLSMYVFRRERSLIDSVFTWVEDTSLIPDTYNEDINTFRTQFTTYFRERTDVLGRVIIVILGCKVLLVAQLYVLLLAFGMSASLLTALYFAIIIEIAYGIPSYMGLGFLEGGYTSFGTVVSVTSSVALGISLLIRMRDILASVYGVIILALGSYYE